MTRPWISCLCPTFGRAPERLWLLEEAVESFVRQDYPLAERELVILNDCPGQTLACDVPGVVVVNTPFRYRSLGEKFNALVKLAEGRFLFLWEDDDISLPGRIRRAVERLRNYQAWVWDQGAAAWLPRDTTPVYFNPQRSFFYAQRAAGPEGTGFHTGHSHGVCHNASAFTREAWRAAKGYPLISGAQDAVMDSRLKAAATVLERAGDDPGDWDYVYRWGVSDIHLSGHGDTERAYAEHGGKRFPEGTFAIKPRWLEDYAALAAAATDRHRAARDKVSAS